MYNPIDVHVGQRIRQRRLMIGITQEQLAAASGVKFQQIQKYETGMNRVSASRLWEFTEALQVPITYFFEGLDSTGETTTDAPVVDTKEAGALLRTYFAIPTHQRKLFHDLARSLAHPPDAAQSAPRDRISAQRPRAGSAGPEQGRGHPLI